MSCFIKKILSWWINDYIPSFIKDLTNIVSANRLTPLRWKSSWQQELKKKGGCLVNHLLDCMLTLVQDSPHSTVLEEQLISKDAEAEKEGVLLQQSLGENNPIALEEQPSDKDVRADNDGSGHDGKSTVKSLLKSSAYLIFFRALPGIDPSQTAMPKKSKDWQVLLRTLEGEAYT